jgi:hypothetical protein
MRRNGNWTNSSENSLPGRSTDAQVIEFVCNLAHSWTRKGGHSNHLYSRETALALLNLTTNFTPDWTREKAITAVTEAQRK